LVPVLAVLVALELVLCPPTKANGCVGLQWEGGLVL